MVVTAPRAAGDPPTVTLQRLLDEHERIAAMCGALIVAATRMPLDLDGILVTRTDLSAELHDHLGREDSDVYPAMLLLQGEPQRIVAAFVAEFADLTRDWSRYLVEWSAESIVADHDTFRVETEALIARLRDRVGREDVLLYPAALRSGAIGLRTASARLPLPMN